MNKHSPEAQPRGNTQPSRTTNLAELDPRDSNISQLSWPESDESISYKVLESEPNLYNPDHPNKEMNTCMYTERACYTNVKEAVKRTKERTAAKAKSSQATSSSAAANPPVAEVPPTAVQQSSVQPGKAAK